MLRRSFDGSELLVGLLCLIPITSALHLALPMYCEPQEESPLLITQYFYLFLSFKENKDLIFLLYIYVSCSPSYYNSETIVSEFAIYLQKLF